MNKIWKGSCLCGTIRYEATGDPMMTGHCHCLDCQKSSGADHTSMLAFPAEAVKVTGKLANFDSKADSGATVTRSFCPKCGSSVIGRSSGMPGMMTVTVGTLDGAQGFKPMMRVYDKRRRTWDAIDTALPSFPSMPPTPG